jgi:hypothetical protein
VRPVSDSSVSIGWQLVHAVVVFAGIADHQPTGPTTSGSMARLGGTQEAKIDIHNTKIVESCESLMTRNACPFLRLPNNQHHGSVRTAPAQTSSLP